METKAIEGYRNTYYASEDGKIYSNSRKGRSEERTMWEMTMRHDEGGNLFVSLQGHDGKQKNVRVSRLVAIAFVPNPDNLPEVIHKDGDKENNHKDNLEWCHHGEHTIRINARNRPVKEGPKLTPEDVRELEQTFHEDTTRHESKRRKVAYLVEKYGADAAEIRAVKQGKHEHQLNTI